MLPNAKIIRLKGIVQGVGFRPFVFKLAGELAIKGWVTNSGQGVYIHAEGYKLEEFLRRLQEDAPPLAKILQVQSETVDFENYQAFEIRQSEDAGEPDVLISPDVATCRDCLRDMQDPYNRRYQYPFTNCTNCGPRYTIIRGVPYDRDKTTMSDFPMCRDCAEEYRNPLDRRFHAQPVACAECGPEVKLVSNSGEVLPGLGIKQLEQGKILAVKGLGGFHLVCDARNEEAVERLRRRKERGAKPFAVMARSLTKAREEVEISAQEEGLLLSTAAPIVILERTGKHLQALPESIAPGIRTLGLMLPYTPLHHLLFEGEYDFLVVTSANLSGQPLIYTNKEALAALNGIADYFLLHDREIYHPCDDSVVQVIGGEPVFFRRARGYVPLPVVFESTEIKTPLLGAGGDLKNAFCLASGNRAFLSQYLGDLAGYETLQRFQQELDSFQEVVNITPEGIVHDRHPNYQSTRFALEQSLPRISVQHHHAHLASVLGEWEISQPTLGIICDGTGYGTDHCIWGFEVLYGNARDFQRKAHLEYLPLPGGDAGVKHPLRIAYAYLKTLLSGEEWAKTSPLWNRLAPDERQVLDRQLASGLQIFRTSSAGRLFDAVSGMLGVCTEVTYEGQAAIELESAAAVFLKTEQKAGTRTTAANSSTYPYEIRLDGDHYVLGVKPLFTELMQDILQKKPNGEIALRFHLTIARAIVDLALKFQEEGSLVLSGGVFQNKLLTEFVLQNFSRTKLKVLRSRALPPGDGGLAFGQILIANEVF